MRIHGELTEDGCGRWCQSCGHDLVRMMSVRRSGFGFALGAHDRRSVAALRIREDLLRSPAGTVFDPMCTNDSLPIPADDAGLANLLSIWGYELNEEGRVYLHRRGRVRRADRDATCSMAYVRGLIRENPTIQDLREMLAGFAPASP